MARVYSLLLYVFGMLLPSIPHPQPSCWLGTQRTKLVIPDDCLTVQLTGHPMAPNRMSPLLSAAPSIGGYHFWGDF